MIDLLKDPLNWLLCTLGTIVLFFPSTLLSVSDKTPVDGLFTVGFPLIFFKKGYFPPMEEFLGFALIFNVILLFVISSIIIFSSKLLWNSFHSVNYH